MALNIQINGASGFYCFPNKGHQKAGIGLEVFPLLAICTQSYMNAECQNEERPILTVRHQFLFFSHLQNQQQFDIHLACFPMIAWLPERQHDGEAELRLGPQRYLLSRIHTS